MSDDERRASGLDALATAVSVFQVVMGGLVLLLAVSLVMWPTVSRLFGDTGPEPMPDVIVLPAP
ncbi:MAG: hypothetical protein KTR31_29135 [Myxococcales bacterium]|nr:hypothetical protein [Myxococcales bacterium]